jgi:multidrug efflux pump subunit AcrA (membrane-fusion protein)
VLVVLLGVLDEALMSVLVPGVAVVLLAEPELLMSVLVPGVVVLPAPMDVPLPVVVSVLPGVVVLAVLLLVSLGDVVVEGVVLDVVDDELEASSRLPQALSDSAAIRARAAQRAIGDLIIRDSLRGCVELNRER